MSRCTWTRPWGARCPLPEGHTMRCPLPNTAPVAHTMRELRNVARNTWCTWCTSPDFEQDDGTLCEVHQAEHDGLSVDEIERRDREQADEAAEWLCGLG